MNGICNWTKQDDYYETECNEAYEFFSGVLEDNSFTYCPFCGNNIKEK